MLAVTADRVFDGDRLLERPVVLLDGDRVVAAGEPAPASADTLHLAGVTLLPGLIDSHQHLCFDGHGSLEEQVVGVDDPTLVARARESALRALHAGVTTIRDVGDRGYLTLDLRGDPELPTVLASGPPLTRIDGHCWYLGGECPDDETSLRAAVRDRAANGCDLVKLMVTGGVLTPTFPVWRSQFGVDEIRAVVDEAHALGLAVAAHCHGTQGILDAADAGVDTIEHCSFVGENGMTELDEAVLARVAASGSVLCVDAGAMPFGEPPPIIKANLETVRRGHARLHELGATVIFGSDAGIALAKLHDVLPHGVWAAAEHGIPVIDVLRGCTSTAARSIGLGARKGRLAPGFDADLVAVAGDPLTDLRELAATVAVWKGGARVR